MVTGHAWPEALWCTGHEATWSQASWVDSAVLIVIIVIVFVVTETVEWIVTVGETRRSDCRGILLRGELAKKRSIQLRPGRQAKHIVSKRADFVSRLTKSQEAGKHPNLFLWLETQLRN